MNSPRAVRYLVCFILLFAALGGLLGGSVVFAAEEGDNDPDSPPPGQEEVPPEGPIEFECGFPSVEGSGNETFKYDVLVIPATNEVAGAYDFNVIAPPGWEATVWGDHPAKRVGTIDFGGRRVASQVMTVRAEAIKGKTPEPGEYVITLEMTSGELKGTFDLTAVVTANYEFNIRTDTGRLSTEVKGTEDKHISILLENTGTAAIDNIILSAIEPEGWNITFDPDKIDSLEPGLKQEVDVVVRPPERAIVNDYTVTLRAESENGTETLKLRITVQAPRTMTAAGIGITASVIVGLVFLFKRTSMRYTTGASRRQ
jgi:uncharacterized membrane protein